MQVYGSWYTMLQPLVVTGLQLTLVGVLLHVRGLVPGVSHWLAGHTSKTERALLSTIAQEAYHFANAAASGTDGALKRTTALDYAALTANRMGLSVTTDELRATIEWVAQNVAAAAG